MNRKDIITTVKNNQQYRVTLRDTYGITLNYLAKCNMSEIKDVKYENSVGRILERVLGIMIVTQ